MTNTTTIDRRLTNVLSSAPRVKRTGRVKKAYGITLTASGVDGHIGQTCHITDPLTNKTIRAEIVGLSSDDVILSPLDSLGGLSPLAEVSPASSDSLVPFGNQLLGRVLDAHCAPLDDLGPLPEMVARPIYAASPNPMSRPPIEEVFRTGIRSIDGPLTVGVGQRLGIFAMAGVGKSTLLGMLAKSSDADVNVIALIGERGREVREFIEDTLGPAGLKRSVVIVATSDRPARERVRAAHVATAIAEGFRDQGRHALLMMDSVTRFARALREIGLAIGEPPVRRGLPASVFAELPQLFERTGCSQSGAITALYNVLVEDEDGDDPVGEETRSILDGHIVLSRDVAQRGRYPAIDVTASLSRLFPKLTPPAQKSAAEKLRRLIAKYNEIEFLIQVGEYQEGADPVADEAIRKQAAIDAFLKQGMDERSDFDETIVRLIDLDQSVEGLSP